MLSIFFQDRRGVVAIIFAIFALPLAAAVGTAVDYSRANNARTSAQAVVDAAVVTAVARHSSFDQRAAAERFMDARVGELAHGARIETYAVDDEVDATTGGRKLTISASGSVDTAFLKLIGWPDLDFAVNAHVEVSGKAYEVAMVVDVTGSMRGSRIAALRDSAASFVRTLLPENVSNDRIRISIIPYTASVNIGRSRASFLAEAAPGLPGVYRNRYVFSESEVPEPHCRGTNVTWNEELKLCHIGALATVQAGGSCAGVVRDGVCYVADGWGGCVLERFGTPHELTEATPTVAPFSPYYWASWGGVGNGGGSAAFNSYLPGPLDESWATNGDNNNGRGPNLGCPKNEIVSWTNDRNRLLTEVGLFRPWHRGGTMGHVGLLWGWRMLAPEWRGLWEDAAWPRDYGAETTEKIVVFMTDGENAFFSGSAPANDSDYTAYGRLSQTGGAFTRSNNTARLDERMLSVCQAMRAKGIEIFTVGFQLSGSGARNLLRDCATSHRHFFDSNVSNLVTHFTAIAADIHERRVVITR